MGPAFSFADGREKGHGHASVRRRTIQVLVAISVALTIVGSAHNYIAARLVRDTSLPSPYAAWANAAIALGALLLFAHPIGERTIGPRIGRLLGWPAFLWLGACFYLLLGLGVTDLVLWMTMRAVSVDLARARALAVGACTLGLMLFGAWSALRPPPIKRVEVRIAGWPAALQGYRIVQISDIHIGSLVRRKFATALVARCNALEPDLLAITGDLVDGSVHHLAEEVAPFGSLRARDGVYFVTGNHDSYSGADRWVRQLEQLGICVLRNRGVTLGRDGANFRLAGVNDLSSARLNAPDGHDLAAALLDWEKEVPLVLLAHDPRTFEEAHAHGIGLQLSGHTHGGQMWPFLAFVRLQTRYVSGLYRRGDAQLYVSRGTGFWGPPMRLLAPSEITEIVLWAA
jgi:hypothetical protein